MDLASLTRRIHLPARWDRWVLLLIVCYLIGLLFFFRARVHGSDPVAYYSWLRSAVIEGTLDVRHTWEHYQNEAISAGDEFYATTQTGYQYNHWAAGSAVLWAPFFLIAHTGVLLADAIGATIPADGYSLPYVASAGFASSLYAFIGMLLLYRIARRFAPAKISAACTITIWFGTPLVFYAYSNPLMAHANDAFLYLLFIFVWLRTREHPSALNWLLMGIVIGLATWVRVQNILLVLIPASEALLALRDQTRTSEMPAKADVPIRTQAHGSSLGARLRRWLWQIGPFTAGLVLTLLPLMAFWKIVYGSWIVNTYTATEGSDFFQWTQPRLLYALFSSDRGLFTWTPVFLVSIAGVIPLWRIDRRLTCLLLFNFLTTYYITASLKHGWGASFGNRYFVGQTGFFGLSLTALTTWIQRRTSLRLMAALGVAFIAWNLLLMAQYAVDLVPHAGPVDLGQMVINQGRVVGVVLGQLGTLVAARFAK